MVRPPPNPTDFLFPLRIAPRFVFYAERTGVLVDHIPAPGEENPDFEEMKRYKK